MCNETWDNCFPDVERHMKAITQPAYETFVVQCKTGLYPLKFHFLNSLVGDVDHFDSFHAVGNSPIQRYNVHIKDAYRSTSNRQSSGIMEMARAMELCSTPENRQDPARASKAKSALRVNRARFEKSDPALVEEGYTTRLSFPRDALMGDHSDRSDGDVRTW